MSPVIPVPGRLEGARVALRPLRDDDVPRYLAAFGGDPALGRDVGLPRDPDEAAARAAVSSTLPDAGPKRASYSPSPLAMTTRSSAWRR